MKALRRCAGAGLVLFLLGAAAPVASAQYPPTTESGEVSAARVTAGSCVTFEGSGFRPVTDVTVTDNGAFVRTTDAGVTGTFSTSVCPTVLGVHLLRGTGTAVAGGTHTVTAEVTVVAALSTTGASGVLPAVGAGASLVLLGAAFVYVARRRRVVRFS